MPPIQPAFIFGCGYSGTSLPLGILRRHLTVLTAARLGARILNQLRNPGWRHTLDSLGNYVRRVIPGK